MDPVFGGRTMLRGYQTHEGFICDAHMFMAYLTQGCYAIDRFYLF